MIFLQTNHCLRQAAAGSLVLIIAACGSSPTSISSPAATRPATPLPDTTTQVSLLTHNVDTSAELVNSSLGLTPDSIPKLLLVESRTVAPELRVTIKGTFVSDAIQNPRRIVTITQRGRLIYADTTADFLYEAPFSSRIYPLWVPTGPSAGELLLDVQSPPDLGLARRFFLRAGQVVKIDTLPVFEEKARNLDNDLALEYGGYRYSGEHWTDEQGHEWQAYNPKLYFEKRRTGLMLDTALTKQNAIARYGVFRGFNYSDKPGIRVRRPH